MKAKKEIVRVVSRLNKAGVHWVTEKNFPAKKGERVYLECEFVKVGKTLSLRTNFGQTITIRDFDFSEIFVENKTEEVSEQQ